MILKIEKIETRTQLEAILPLIDAYQEFYGSESNREKNRTFFTQLLGSERGIQLVAKSETGDCLGFATIFRQLSSVSASEFLVMNDLFVLPSARGKNVGKALIQSCQKYANQNGFTSIEWQTQRENHTAQKLYDRMNDHKSHWITYALRSKNA